MQPLSKKAASLVLLLVLVYSALTIGRAIHYARHSAGSDLRIREVGSRLLSTGYSPYFYKWQPKDGTVLLDPLDADHRYVNGNVVTPATLMLLYPLYRFDHRDVYITWTLAQLLAAGLTIFLLFRKRNGSDHVQPATNQHDENWLGQPTHATGKNQRMISLALVVAGLFCSNHFLFNLERGQMYTFYTLAFALMYALYMSRWKQGQLLSGLLCGLMFYFRPFFILAGLGFLVYRKKKWLLGVTIGLFTGFLLFVLPAMDKWKDYSAAMTEYINEYMGHPTGSAWTSPTGKPYFVEGVDFTKVEGFSLGCFDTVYFFASRVGIRPDRLQCTLLLGITLLVAAFVLNRRRTPGAAFALNRKRTPGAEPLTLFLFGFGCYLMGELFTPAPRGAYNVILWVFPLSLIALHFFRDKKLMAALVSGLLLLHAPLVFPRQHDLAELVFMGVLVYALVFANNSSRITAGG